MSICPGTISGPAASLVHDTRDDPLDPRRGHFLLTDTILSSRWLGGNTLVKGFVQGTTYQLLTAHTIVALSAQLGLARTFGEEQLLVPKPDRFFAGGDYSMRGFGVDEVLPDGGNALLIGGIELRRHLVGAFWAAAFAEAGNVYPLVSDMSLRRPPLHRRPRPALQERGRAPPVRLGLQARPPARREPVSPPLHDRQCVLICVIALLLLAVPGRAAVVERILAVVDGRPVLLSEVAVFQKVRGEAERQALDGLIDEQLMYREAARLPQAALTAEEEQRAFESLQARIPSTSADDEEQLRRLSRRQAAILKYVDFRFRPQVRVSEEAVRAAYEAQSRPDGRSFEEAAPALRAALAEDDLTRRIEEWVKELRRSAEIRYNDTEESTSMKRLSDGLLSPPSALWGPVWESWPPRKVRRRDRHPAPGPRRPLRTFGLCLRPRRRRPWCRVPGRRSPPPWLRFGRKTKRRSSTRSASCWGGRRPSSPSPPRRQSR